MSEDRVPIDYTGVLSDFPRIYRTPDFNKFIADNVYIHLVLIRTSKSIFVLWSHDVGKWFYNYSIRLSGKIEIIEPYEKFIKRRKLKRELEDYEKTAIKAQLRGIFRNVWHRRKNYLSESDIYPSKLF